jgi:agmatine deiminase
MKTWVITAVFSSLLLLIATAAEKSPKALGYSFPDEWEQHKGTMMIFPAQHSYGHKTKALRQEFVNIVKAIAANEPVEVFCLTAEDVECRKMLDGIPNVTVHAGDYPIDWARDNAPMLVRNADGQLASAGFRQNGWGRKYRGWEDDVDTRDNISRDMGWPVFRSDLVLEGGAIEIGGSIGIVTESCVLNTNRTDWSKVRVEHELKKMLGLEKIIWIKSGLMPDPVTDGHVDGLLKFISENTVLLHTTDLKTDPNYRICQDARRTLLDNGLNVIELPLLGEVVHMNFYIGSGGNVAYVPVSGDAEQDEASLEVIRRYFKQVVPILANHIARAGGGIHCYTQQIPR